MVVLNNVIDFFTDANGIGFPILITAVLGAILYLMNYTSKGWNKTIKKVNQAAQGQEDKNYPFKPF